MIKQLIALLLICLLGSIAFVGFGMYFYGGLETASEPIELESPLN